MTNPVALPSARPVWAEPFAGRTNHGLFAAPWQSERPAPGEVLAVQEESKSRVMSEDGLTAVSGHLLAVRSFCLLAAMAHDPVVARDRYRDALMACQHALDRLDGADGGLPGALAAWARGVHGLIRAQLVMPDLKESERLAREAAILLTEAEGDPVCRGAGADARWAVQLAREPAELTRRLGELPAQVTDSVDLFRHKIEKHETLLNNRLGGVRAEHRRAFVATVAWVFANLALMASLPLNGLWRPDLSWSIPFVVLVPVLWWWTWDRPYREGLSFFAWHAARRQMSLALFHDAARKLPDPLRLVDGSLSALMQRARLDHVRLVSYHLYELPARWDLLPVAEKIAGEGRELFAGVWMVELEDRKPWPLTDVLPVEPSMVPKGTRIWFGGETA